MRRDVLRHFVGKDQFMKQQNKLTNMESKNIVYAGIAALAIILIVFALGISESVEITIFVIVGLLSIFTLWGGFKDEDKKLIGIGFLGIAIAFGLAIWSDANSSSRSKKRLQEMRENRKARWAEQAKQDSIQHIEDSIQHHKDSIRVAEESKKLYEKEGETIFGKFLFGMSKKDFDGLMTVIGRETNGVISISDYDFKIDDYKFYNNKLYSLTLRSTNTWTRYYYHDANEYEEDNDGSEKVKHIIDSFSKKYGSPNNRARDWHFNHKDISVYANSYYKTREGLLSTERWAIFIFFVEPKTEGLIYKEEQNRKRKEEQEYKAAEEELKKKKEAYGGGL